MRRAALLGVVLLAGCGAPDQAPAPATSETAPEPSTPPSPAAQSPPPTPMAAPTRELSMLESRDCRTVAQAYFDALTHGDYAHAARVWADPAIGEARLQAIIAGYKKPTFIVADLQQEGAAGSSYCTVSGTLTDADDPAKAPQKGQILLKRVNDVPGATPEQLRWTIRSSTFVEKIGRSG